MSKEVVEISLPGMKEAEIPKAYDPKIWEDELYRRWKESGFFNPDVCVEKKVTAPDAPVFSIVLPPPNVTGVLHTGHAAMLAIQDAFVRFHRMRGDRTLWLPGTDHAAIATQSRVEKDLRSEGRTRFDLGREAFLKRVREFAQSSHDTIVHQVAKMGSSVDWSREAYTLDQEREQAVRTAFKKMYDDGIIYRGERIVNWDPEMQTTVSDDEIEYVTQKDPFYYFQYGPFVIGTVRPETKFGDKYVVMHPDDARYQKYQHGEKINLEWINGSITATIIKDPAADMKTGSGAMTITPAHSVVDFEIAKRHNLDLEQVIDEKGRLLPIAGEFAREHIAEARPKIIEKLRAKGLLVKIDETYEHNVATNSRGGGIIEPQIKKQWFIDVNKKFWRGLRRASLKSLMQEAVRSQAVTILPERFEKTYFHWINNLRDWCISRQIWFGHRIPVWYRGGEMYCGMEAPEGEGWEQDPDTLDTWFSSGLWTFSTLGWPGKTNDLKTYHPTTLLETGYDILFFWVARMILMSEYLLNEVPFRTVYLHGLVRDEQGRKMSKSLGNIIDPLDVIEKFGADSLRLALVVGSTPGNDLRLSDEKILSYRNFVNKLWNMSRYVAFSVSSLPENLTFPTPKTDADQWILNRLSEVSRKVTEHLENYQLSMASETLRDFSWNEFADWYIEIHKIEKNDEVLGFVFATLLRLWHPFMPFATEAIYQNFHPGQLLMVAKWPAPEENRAAREASDFQSVQELITKIRNTRSLYRIDPKQTIPLTLVSSSPVFERNEHIVKRLARLENISYQKEGAFPASARIIGKNYTGYLLVSSVLNIEEEKTRLNQEKESLESYKRGIEKRLGDEKFRGKAPMHVIEQNEKSLLETEKKIAEISQALAGLN